MEVQWFRVQLPRLGLILSTLLGNVFTSPLSILSMIIMLQPICSSLLFENFPFVLFPLTPYWIPTACQCVFVLLCRTLMMWHIWHWPSSASDLRQYWLRLYLGQYTIGFAKGFYFGDRAGFLSEGCVFHPRSKTCCCFCLETQKGTRTECLHWNVLVGN